MVKKKKRERKHALDQEKKAYFFLDRFLGRERVFFYKFSPLKVALGMLQLSEDRLVKAETSADIFNILSSLPAQVLDLEICSITCQMLLSSSIPDLFPYFNSF